MIRGTPRFDGLTLGEMTVSFLGPPGAVHLEAKAAFVDASTGSTHGWTKCTTWSKETLERLTALKDAMERDIAAVHFGEAMTPGSISPSAPAGLGEFLDTAKDAPQV